MDGFLYSLLVACIPAVLSGFISYLVTAKQNKQERQKLRDEQKKETLLLLQKNVTEAEIGHYERLIAVFSKMVNEIEELYLINYCTAYEQDPESVIEDAQVHYPLAKEQFTSAQNELYASAATINIDIYTSLNDFLAECKPIIEWGSTFPETLGQDMEDYREQEFRGSEKKAKTLSDRLFSIITTINQYTHKKDF